MLCDRFINIEPSAVDEERDTTNASVEESHENLTSVEQNIIRGATVPGETQNSDLSTTNTTMSLSLPTKLWNDLNTAKEIVCISFNCMFSLKIFIIK